MLNPGNKLRLAYGTRESRESKFARNIIDRETDSSKLETHAAVRSKPVRKTGTDGPHGRRPPTDR